MPTSYEASTQIIIANNLRAAMTSNSGYARENLEQRDKEGKNQSHNNYRSHAARSRKRLKPSAPMRDWEIIEVGLASHNWDSAFNSEGGYFGVIAA